MNLTKLVLKRPVSMVMIILALIVFGFSAITGAPLELMPEMEMPVLLVMTTYPGAGPQEVEDLVTSQLESSVSTLNGIKTIQSVSQDSVSLMVLQLEYGTNMDVAHMDLQEKLNMYSGALPDDAQDPIIIEMDLNSMSAITLSARATGDIDLLSYIDEYIKPEFEKLGGVASVDVSGGQENYISVELDEQRLKQYGLDMSTIVSFIGAADFSIPVGDIDRGDQSLSLRGGVSYDTVESLGNIPITLRSGQVIHLSDVARIYDATADADSISRYNGNETVSLGIKKRQSAGTIEVTEAVVKTMEQINARNMGVELSVINDTSDSIRSSVNSVIKTLISAIILCMIVLFIFFGDWKASLIVGSSIPVSVLTTLILMNAFGFSFNIVSLGGLVIGVGMMVDNSIVVLESCFQRRERNLTFRDAAIEGARIVTSSVAASTLTTVVVFLPISIMEGLSGQMFRQLGFTIVFSLTASLISALTIVPLLFYRLAPKEKEDSHVNRVLNKITIAYGNFLKKTFRHKLLVVLISVGLLVGSFMLLPFIHFQLMPDIDQGTISISVETKPGLKLEKVDALMTQLESMVQESTDVERYYLTAGGGAMTSTGNESGSLTVYLKADRERSTNEWIDEWREQTKDIPNCDISISAQSMMSFSSGGSVDVNLQGNDLDLLREASKDVEAVMGQNPNIVRVSSTLTSGNPQAEIVVDPIKATAVGMTPQQVVGTVYNMVSGTSPATMDRDGREYDIRIEFPKERFQTVSDLSGLILTSPSGKQVPLLDIASIEYSNAPQSIQRKNNQYIVTISGQPTTASALTAGDEIKQAVAELELPEGVAVTQNQADEQMMEEFGALFGAIATAVFLVFMVMAMQFESCRFSIIVMICIPFSLIGSFGLMLLSGVTMSMPSLIGFLMLVGTVINNGILFIDTANQYRSSMDAETALVYAGRSRLRPILMTTLTTVLSMIPMGLGIGEGAEAMQGMAVVIIGGLTASTILTLLLLPTFYLLFRGRPHKEYKKEEDTKNGNAHPDLSQEELITQ